MLEIAHEHSPFKVIKQRAMIGSTGVAHLRKTCQMSHRSLAHLSTIKQISFEKINFTALCRAGCKFDQICYVL